MWLYNWLIIEILKQIYIFTKKLLKVILKSQTSHLWPSVDTLFMSRIGSLWSKKTEKCGGCSGCKWDVYDFNLAMAMGNLPTLHYHCCCSLGSHRGVLW